MFCCKLVCMAGLEPATSWFEVKHSIQLNYMQILEARTGFEPVNDGFADRPLNHLSISPSVFYYITNNLFCQLFYGVFLRKSKRKRATVLSVAHKQKRNLIGNNCLGNLRVGLHQSQCLLLHLFNCFGKFTFFVKGNTN